MFKCTVRKLMKPYKAFSLLKRNEWLSDIYQDTTIHSFFCKKDFKDFISRNAPYIIYVEPTSNNHGIMVYVLDDYSSINYATLKRQQLQRKRNYRLRRGEFANNMKVYIIRK